MFASQQAVDGIGQARLAGGVDEQVQSGFVDKVFAEV
jgi:hypothetical protein